MAKLPWERQEKESGKAFKAFTLYRDMLPRARSFDKVREELGKKPSYRRVLERWSSLYQWVARVTSRDDQLAQEAAEANADEIRQMGVLQAQQGRVLQTVGLRNFMREDSEGKLTPKKNMPMKDGDAIRAIKVGTDIERTARGEPSAIIEGKIKIIKEMSDEELEAIAKTGRTNESD